MFLKLLHELEEACRDVLAVNSTLLGKFQIDQIALEDRV
jgi:hypothetical protein